MKPFSTSMVVFLLLSASLLSSCAPKTQAVTEPQIRKLEQGETLIINTTLNLWTFPRSVVYQMAEDKNKTTYVFYTPVLIDSVFDAYHYQLVGNGWVQETIRKREKEYEALYSRQGQRLTLKLKLEADRYILRTS
jgi:hypothetical protein